MVSDTDTPKVLCTLEYYQKGHKKNRPLCAPNGSLVGFVEEAEAFLKSGELVITEI